MKISGLTIDRFRLDDGFEKLCAKIGIPDGVVQDAFSLARKTRDDCLRSRLREGAGLFARRDSHRQSIRLGRAINVADLDEPEAGRTRAVGKAALLNDTNIPQGAGF